MQKQENIQFIFILFAINILIYGQKLFFYALPADDFMRFYGDTNTNMLISYSARWGQALLNKYIFVEALQILPYLHGLIGIFSFTLMGYLIARYLKLSNTFHITISTLLFAVSPMFAHNLYFSTNITTWITLLLGMIGFLMISYSKILMKSIGFIFLIFSISNYQTIIQMLLLLLVFYISIALVKSQNFNSIIKAFVKSFFIGLLILFAYILSQYINGFFLDYYDLPEKHRLSTADSLHYISFYWEQIKHSYDLKYFIKFNYFQHIFEIFYLSMAFLTLLSVSLSVLLQKFTWKLKITKILLFLILMLLVPILLNLPLILGVEIPTRAHFSFGIALSGFFILQTMTLNKKLQIFSKLLSFLIIIVSIYYITIFFDACTRQTEADIRRANTIVERIRLSDIDSTEPIHFHIVGHKKFNVKGWSMQWQQPFNHKWAKYKIFEYFTDLKFTQLNEKEILQAKEYISNHYKHIEDYPSKKSMITYQNNVFLFLDSREINSIIKKKTLLKKMPKKVDIRSDYDIMVSENILFYQKNNCSEEDKNRQFFLRIYPKNPNTYSNGKKVYPFQNWDFKFYRHGIKINGQCLLAISLPKYEISRIRTGQLDKLKNITWEVNYLTGASDK